MWLVSLSGLAACLYSIKHLQAEVLGGSFLLLTILTVTIASRIVVEIPRVPGAITLSDIFIFLTILLFGGESAVVLATIEGFCSTIRISKKPFTYVFNAAAMACSTFLCVTVLTFIFGDVRPLARGEISLSFIGVVCVMGIVQYLANSGIVAKVQSLRIGQTFLSTWRHYYLRTSISYFAAAIAAAIIARISATIGFYSVLATIPIVAIVYFTYRTYCQNIEASAAQADQAERHLREMQRSEERFRIAFNYTAVGMAIVEPTGRWLQVNASLCQLVGYTDDELLATDFQSLTHPDDLTTTLASIKHLLDGRTPTCQIEKRYLHKDGHEVWALLSVAIARDAEVETTHFIFQIQDITDRKRAEERLVYDAFHDALTGLPNRALFIDHLKLAIARSHRNTNSHFAVLFLDLDRFKIVNDSLGHMIGDELLVAISRRLEDCLRPGDTVARLGGDEFTILLDDLRDTAEAVQVAERIRQDLLVPFNLHGHEVFTGASIGIAPSTVGYDLPEDVLRDADTAMYRAKSLGTTRHEVFDKAMHAQATNLLQLETDLRRAIERREFVVYYQPIIQLDSHRVSGFEALIRWQHPEHGFISPAEFIPIAEDTGLIVPIGRWVLEEACQQMRDWQQTTNANHDLVMSVNLSGKQFAQSDLITDIKDVLAQTQLDPRCLKLEITESVVMENIETAVGMLDQLRALGITLSIDDFGTGYSSLSYLHRFPLSTLKIDRSFVSLMLGNNENSEIVRTIVMLAQNLGMDVVAEGVETDDQLAVLRAIGCKYGQGYLFSRPIPASQAAGFLAVSAAPPSTVVCNVTVNADAGIDLVPTSSTAPHYDAPPKGGIDLHVAA